MLQSLISKFESDTWINRAYNGLGEIQYLDFIALQYREFIEQICILKD